MTQTQGRSSSDFRPKQINTQVLSQVTGHQFVVYDFLTQKPIISKKAQKRTEIASLTKIITAITAIHIIKKHDIELDELIQVPSQIIGITGTLAKLEILTYFKIEDMLYALMLPSGNDAALVLADALGKYCKGGGNGYKENKKAFIRQMNKIAQKMKMTSSIFQNVHGLGGGKKYNISSADDCATMSCMYLKNELLKKICETKVWECEGIKFGNKVQYQWKNTNKLLGQKQVFGLKTGITPSAGPCLATCFKIQERVFICIVINSSSQKQKFIDTEILIDFCNEILLNT